MRIDNTRNCLSSCHSRSDEDVTSTRSSSSDNGHTTSEILSGSRQNHISVTNSSGDVPGAPSATQVSLLELLPFIMVPPGAMFPRDSSAIDEGGFLSRQPTRQPLSPEELRSIIQSSLAVLSDDDISLGSEESEEWFPSIISRRTTEVLSFPRPEGQ